MSSTRAQSPALAKAGPPPCSPPVSPATSSAAQAEPTKVAAALVPAPPVLSIEPTTVTVQHWSRLAQGELFARARYIEWAVLMKRTWALNVMRCPKCERRMRVIATVTAPSTVRRILEHLRLRADPLPRAPARDPTWEQQDLSFAAGVDAGAA
jgi:hypothetical protein